MLAVFGALNQGGDVTKGLKKVDKSEMTHKNPTLRGNAPVVVAERNPVVPRKPETFKKKAPPKKELDGTKWIVVRMPLTILCAMICLCV